MSNNEASKDVYIARKDMRKKIKKKQNDLV